jgi:hypothetical protein
VTPEELAAEEARVAAWVDRCRRVYGVHTEVPQPSKVQAVVYAPAIVAECREVVRQWKACAQGTSLPQPLSVAVIQLQHLLAMASTMPEGGKDAGVA